MEREERAKMNRQVQQQQSTSSSKIVQQSTSTQQQFSRVEQHVTRQVVTQQQQSQGLCPFVPRQGVLLSPFLLVFFIFRRPEKNLLICRLQIGVSVRQEIFSCPARCVFHKKCRECDMECAPVIRLCFCTGVVQCRLLGEFFALFVN